MPKKQDLYSIEKQIRVISWSIPSPGWYNPYKERKTETPICAENFYSCREGFHRNNRILSSLLFSHSLGEGQKIAHFIRKTEKKLGLKKFTQCGPTNVPSISWFKINPFWNKNPLRKTLFTILLRCGRRFSPQHNNFKTALDSNSYILETRPAVDYFFKGNTIPTRKCQRSWRGWFRSFHNKTMADVKKLMKNK
jgi:hypothetical protein